MNQGYFNEAHLDSAEQIQREHTHFAKITENAKGEPSVTVSIYGDNEYAVHEQVMNLYTLLKKGLAKEVTV